MQDSYNNSPPDALEMIFRGPLRWMNLLIIGVNVAVYVLMEVLGSTENIDYMLQWGGAYTPLILDGEWYRLITSMFLHFGIYHLLNNMVLLLFMGDMLETHVGKIKYLLIYFGGGILGNLCSLFWDIHTGSMAVSAGASGAVFAVIGAVFVLVLKSRGRLGDFTAPRMLVMIVLTIYYGFQSTGVDNAAHVGGVIGGVLLAALLYHHKDAGGKQQRDDRATLCDR